MSGSAPNPFVPSGGSATVFSAPRSTQRRKRLAAVAAAALTAPLLWAVGTTAGTAQAAAPTADWLHTRGNQIIDEAGNPVWLTGTNWFGFNATERVFHGLWSANMTEVTKS